MVFKKDGFSAVWIVFLNTYLKRLKKIEEEKEEKVLSMLKSACVYIYIYIYKRERERPYKVTNL